MTSLKTIIGERTDDEAIGFITDVSDTLKDLQGRIEEPSEEIINARVKEKDEEWRKKYIETFFSGKPDTSYKPKDDGTNEDEEDEEDEEPTKFEDLFNVEGE